MFSSLLPHLLPTALSWAAALQGQLLLPGSPHPHNPLSWGQSAQVAHFLHSHHVLSVVPGLCVLYTMPWLYRRERAPRYSQHLQERESLKKNPIKSTPNPVSLSTGTQEVMDWDGIMVSAWGCFQSRLWCCVHYQPNNFRDSNEKKIIS